MSRIPRDSIPRTFLHMRDGKERAMKDVQAVEVQDYLDMLEVQLLLDHHSQQVAPCHSQNRVMRSYFHSSVHAIPLDCQLTLQPILFIARLKVQ